MRITSCRGPSSNFLIVPKAAPPAETWPLLLSVPKIIHHAQYAVFNESVTVQYFEGKVCCLKLWYDAKHSTPNVF